MRSTPAYVAGREIDCAHAQDAKLELSVGGVAIPRKGAWLIPGLTVAA